MDDRVRELILRGVPWYLAVEAVSSTDLDCDEDDGGAHTRRFPPGLDDLPDRP